MNLLYGTIHCREHLTKVNIKYVYVQMLHEDVVHSGKLNGLVLTCDEGNTTIPTKSSHLSILVSNNHLY